MKKMTMQETFAHMAEVAKDCGEVINAAAQKFEDPTRYPVSELIALAALEDRLYDAETVEERMAVKQEYQSAVDALQLLPDAPERIYLWPDAVPTLTDYTENPDYQNNHDPEYRPYLLEMLLPEEKEPVGAVILVAGGNHGKGTLGECYETGLEFNALGYQCFILNCRPNHWPWNPYDTGVDAARAVRMVRGSAEKYRISPDAVALAGFSNGGVTVDSCIQFYSGSRKVSDYYPDYVPDALDDLRATPNAFLCIYGPRYKGAPFCWDGVEYPPTFFAVGRKDVALENLHSMYPDLLAHGVPVEVHTFAGREHGGAGAKLLDGIGDPNFDLWLTHADYFLRDVFMKGETL